MTTIYKTKTILITEGKKRILGKKREENTKKREGEACMVEVTMKRESGEREKEREERAKERGER